MLDSIKKAVKNWWVSLLIGILAIVLGIWCLFSPGYSLMGLTYVFMVGFLLGGILDIFFAVSNRNYMFGWGWTLAGGILEVILAMILLALPTSAVTAILVYLVGFWILFRSIWGIGEACQLQVMGIRGWGWSLALSIICVILSFLYLLSPGFGKGIFVVALISASIIIYGIFRIFIAFKLKEIRKNLKE